jgi:hypothetical protein
MNYETLDRRRRRGHKASGSILLGNEKPEKLCMMVRMISPSGQEFIDSKVKEHRENSEIVPVNPALVQVLGGMAIKRIYADLALDQKNDIKNHGDFKHYMEKFSNITSQLRPEIIAKFGRIRPVKTKTSGQRPINLFMAGALRYGDALAGLTADREEALSYVGGSGENISASYDYVPCLTIASSPADVDYSEFIEGFNADVEVLERHHHLGRLSTY